MSTDAATGAPAFIEPPANGATPGTDGKPIPTTVAPTEVDEEMTIEEAQAEIERLRAVESEADRWKRQARTNERELRKLREKGAGTGGSGTPATPTENTGPTETELRAMRLEVALDTGLPKTLAIRLQGETIEEMADDAKELMKQFRRNNLPGGSADGGGGAPPKVSKSFGDRIREAAGIKAVDWS